MRQIGRQGAVEHLEHILANDGKELEAVEGAAGGEIEPLGRRVGGDDEVAARGEGVPGRGGGSPRLAAGYSLSPSLPLSLPPPLSLSPGKQNGERGG